MSTEPSERLPPNKGLPRAVDCAVHSYPYHAAFSPASPSPPVVQAFVRGEGTPIGFLPNLDKGAHD